MKKLLSIILVLILVVTFMLPLYVSAEDNEQSNITTSFDEKTGTLTVSGRGKAYDIFGRDSTDRCFLLFLSKEDDEEINNTVKHLVIEEGITAIYNCFNNMYALEDVSFPNTLERIDFCFIDCDLLKKVVFPKSLKVISDGAFYDCDGITTIKFSGPLTIGEEFPERGGCESLVFYDLDSIKYVKIPANSVAGGIFKYCKNLKTVVLGANVEFKAAYYSLFDEQTGPPFVGCSEDLKIYTFSKVEIPNDSEAKTYNLTVICMVIFILLVITLSIILLIYFKKRRRI